MTGELRDLLHEQASLPHFDPVATDVVARDGQRAVRRRRGLRTTGLVGGVAVLAVVGVVTLGSGGGGSRVVDPASGPPGPSIDSSDVTWVAGSVLHTPDTSVDLGRRVLAYVTTDAGVVYADPSGQVWLWSDGVSTEVGTTSATAPHLVTDGSTTGWVDASGTAPAFVVLDQATGRTDVLADPHADAKDADLLALDGTTAYWRDDQGIVAVDTTSADPIGSARVVEPPGSPETVLAAHDGVLAFGSNSRGLRIGSSPTTSHPVQADNPGDAAFSPDGAYLTADADDLRVFDASSGSQVSIPTPGYVFAAGYGWLDDTTVEAIASRATTDSSHADLLTCDVAAGSCTVAVGDVGSFDQFAGGSLVLPVGTVADD